MSLNRKTDLDRITEILSYLKSQVELSNPSNFTDINIYAESFYRDFLNLIFGYELSNINIIEPNSAAIDLGDKVSNIAVQVTSTSDLSKIKQTVAKFIGKNLHEEYDRLVILNISMKKNYRTKTVGEQEKYELDTTKDVWDFSNLIKKIGDKGVDEISAIKIFLEGQATIDNVETVATEILTF